MTFTTRRIIRLPEVKQLTGLGRTKIYELMNEEKFPQGRLIAGARVTGWDSAEIDQWIAEQFNDSKSKPDILQIALADCVRLMEMHGINGQAIKNAKALLDKLK